VYEICHAIGKRQVRGLHTCRFLVILLRGRHSFFRKSSSFRKAFFATGYGKTIAFAGREVKYGIVARTKTAFGCQNGRFIR